MKKVFIYAALLAMLAICAVAASASPSFMGATGGVSLPDVNVTPTNTADAALDYHRQDLENADQATNFRLNYGLSDKSEIGFAYTWQSGANYDEGYSSVGLNNWSVNAKYVLPFRWNDLETAVGAQYAKYKDLSTEQTMLYAVAGGRVWESYGSNKALDFNLGVSWIKFDVDEGKSDKFHAFTVAKYRFNPSMQLVGEFQTKAGPDRDPLTSIALRYKMDDSLTWQTGITNSFRRVTGGGHHDWFIGASYSFKGFVE